MTAANHCHPRLRNANFSFRLIVGEIADLTMLHLVPMNWVRWTRVNSRCCVVDLIRWTLFDWRSITSLDDDSTRPWVPTDSLSLKLNRLAVKSIHARLRASAMTAQMISKICTSFTCNGVACEPFRTLQKKKPPRLGAWSSIGCESIESA